MSEIELAPLDQMQALQNLRGKDVISLSDGQILAKVGDILIDPAQKRVSGVVISNSGFLRPEVRVIPPEEIQLWGKDVLLVTHPDVIRKKTELPGLEKSLSAYQNIRGRALITMNGDRVGELRDLLIDPRGELTGFEISHPANALADILKSGKRGIFRLPVSAVQSFGKDVLIVDLDQLQTVAPSAEGIVPSVVEEAEVEVVSGPEEAAEPPVTDGSQERDLPEDEAREEKKWT